jgi:hypothetical protein
MAVDALVALTILSSTIVFALAATEQGQHAARSALEMRRAGDLLTYVAETSRTASGVVSGQTDAFLWRVNIDDPLPSSASESMCAHRVTVTSRLTDRSYSLRTDEICPTQVAQ